MGRIEDAPQVHQYLGLEGIAFAGKPRHNGLNLHRGNIPKTVAADIWEDVLIQNILDGVQAVLPEIGFFVEVVPHLRKAGEGFFAANIHTGIDENLRLHYLFVQFCLGLGPEKFPAAIRHLNRLGEVLIDFLRLGLFLCHKAFSF